MIGPQSVRPVILTADSNKLDSIKVPPFETEDLRKNLVKFLDAPYPTSNPNIKIGDYVWGVYAFYDYDGEPIYVGQTNEKVRTRIRRHLTNQRTDAVAMSVLDPFEVFEISVWPLPQFQAVTKRSDRFVEARRHLNSLERAVYEEAKKKSQFGIVLNEKDPPLVDLMNEIPEPFRQCVVSKEVCALRAHPDVRLARRALIIARLAQVISERKVQGGLRRVLLAQAQRLQSLAERRFDGLGGDNSVPIESEDADEIEGS
jgi:hypothetical protein